LIAIDRVGDEILVKTLGLNLSLFSKRMGFFVFWCGVGYLIAKVITICDILQVAK